MRIIYLDTEEIIKFNILALNMLRIKKADKAEVLSYQKLIDISEGCKSIDGDIYNKAVYLLKKWIKNGKIREFKR